MMADFVSDIKTIPYADAPVFRMLSDLSNLERVRDRIPEDKIEGFTFDTDSCSFEVKPAGRIEFRIIDREPNKTIKFETAQSPVPLNCWIQLKQVDEQTTKLKITLRADLNPFLKPMVSKPLQEAVDKIAELIASLPYE